MMEAVDKVDEAAVGVLHLSTPVLISSILYALSRLHTSKGGSECGRHPSIDALPKFRVEYIQIRQTVRVTMCTECAVHKLT